MTDLLSSLWKQRAFVIGSVNREFEAKYKNSILGAGWAVLTPLATIIVYTLIFSELMKPKLGLSDGAFSYSIYLCAGIIAWGLTAEILTRGQNVFIDHANLLKKVNFPRIYLPLIVVLNALTNVGIISALFLIFLGLNGLLPGLSIIYVIPILLVQLIFTTGLSVVLGVLNVFFRDVGQFFQVFIQFWFWLTPIVYPVDILPESIRQLIFTYNPMAPIIHGYQLIFVMHQPPPLPSLLFPLLIGCLFLFLRRKLIQKTCWRNSG